MRVLLALPRRLGRNLRLEFCFSYSTVCVVLSPKDSSLQSESLGFHQPLTLWVLLNSAGRTFETGPLPSLEPGLPGLQGEQGPKGHQGLKGIKGHYACLSPPTKSLERL